MANLVSVPIRDQQNAPGSVLQEVHCTMVKFWNSNTETFETESLKFLVIFEDNSKMIVKQMGCGWALAFFWSWNGNGNCSQFFFFLNVTYVVVHTTTRMAIIKARTLIFNEDVLWILRRKPTKRKQCCEVPPKSILYILGTAPHTLNTQLVCKQSGEHAG